MVDQPATNSTTKFGAGIFLDYPSGFDVRAKPIEPKRGERRYDKYGEFRVMAVADGWVMARRPRCVPMTFVIKEWWALSGQPVEKEDQHGQ